MKQLLVRFRQSALFKLFVKAGLTLLAFWFVFRGIDFSLLGEMLHKQDRRLLMVAVALMTVQLVTGAFRWRMILTALSGTSEHVLTYLAALKIYYISVFFTCCLPGTVGGDVIRVWLTKSDKVPLSIAIHSVIIDRMIALAALTLMIILTLPILGSLAGFNPLVVFVIVMLAAVAGIFFLINMERLIGRYKQFRVVNWILYFLDSLRLLIKCRSASIKSLTMALSTHTVYCMAAYALAQSFHINITMMQCITLIPPVVLATTLPISIGGWGIREASTIAMLGLIAVPRGQALMLSIQLGIIIVLITLPASILWLLYRKHSPQPIDMNNANVSGIGP